MAGLKQLIQEIHRRSLWQVLLIYIGGALVAYQMIQALTEGLHLPEWFPPFAIVLFIIGLPIVLATAFVQEGVGRGAAQREPSAETENAVAETRDLAKGEARGVRGLFTWRNAIAGGVLAFALWGVIATGWLVLYGRPDQQPSDAGLPLTTGEAAPLARGMSIAVLPFVNMSADQENEYFSDGMTEELITALTRVAGLRVAARTSSFAFKGKSEDIRTIGEQLNVSTVLEGSVRKSGDRLRITAQLVNVEDGYHYWSETYEREMRDVFAIQEDISRNIADKLRITLAGDEAAPLVKHGTENLEAYDLYLKGRYFWNQRGEGLKKGLAYFEAALEEDPKYALAYAGQADSYSLLGIYGYLPPSEAMPKAKAAALRALEIDESIAEAHSSLGFATLYFDWDPVTAEKHFRRAIELNPSYAPAHYWYSGVHAIRKHIDETIREDERALEIDPLSVFVNTQFGWMLMGVREYGRSIAQARRALELDPNFALGHWVLGRALVYDGEHEEGVAALQRALELSSRNPWMLATLGWAYAIAGREEDAREVLTMLDERSKQEFIPSYYFALVHTALGETHQAIESLKRAYEERYWWMVIIHYDPTFDSLRSDPRFVELVEKVGVAPGVE